MSEGSTASAPYTRKNGVNPVDLFGVVRKLHKTEGNSSAQAPAARRSGASRRVLIPPIIIITEGNRELNASQIVSLFSRNHTVKLKSAVFEVCSGKVHLLQGLQVHDVQNG